MLPSGGAVCCSRRTESGKGCKQSIASNRCNRNTIDSRCAPFAAQRWCIPRMKFSVILCSVSTEPVAPMVTKFETFQNRVIALNYSTFTVTDMDWPP
ncbi:hypothetical protein AVEN_232666-1 [Araneus ventricosus]|uniref:Uncharacterized protein n=1 Tax=Araneus ventricosus TaxID=182803 RepID=A0A4Y2S403_ARAVE|nr:hypothetical protein AVEN_232666-1 [Araneus ventricosus]